ncbi:MAG: Mur ligase family protein [Candidatus Berkelbacteria bacterium]|nr:Mur ligase family protein [Candidatus Berkelbacteria bacterium]
MIKLLEKELAFFAKYIYSRFRPFVIGITGSSGKTTTKYFIGELLKKTEKSVYVASGNLNTETGLPLSVLMFSKSPSNILDFLWIAIYAPIKAIFTVKYPKYLVLEYAADKPNDMDYLTQIIAPDVAVITNIGVAHIEAFGSVEKIAEEKWKLATATKQKIITTHDVFERCQNLTKPNAEILLVPDKETIYSNNIKFLTNKTEFDLFVQGEKFTTSFQFLGVHNIWNLELALLALLNVTGNKKMIDYIDDLTPLDGRGNRFVGRRDILVIDESYNANPLSMMAALEVMDKIKYGRKVAILGEMKEIGKISDKSHIEISKAARKIAKLTIGVGEGFKEANLDYWYANVGELEKEIDNILKPNDIVLVKGSRSNHLEKIVEKLK